MRARANWLSEAEKGLIADEAMGLLERVGLRMAGSRALQMLAGKGATVDEATSVVRIPRRLVEEALALCPREIVLGGSAPEYDVVLADGNPTAFCSSGCAAFVLDPDTGERRPSTLADLRTATALLDESPAVDVMWTTVTANDVPIEERELVGYAVVLEESHKHVTFVDSPSQAEPLLRIAEIVGGAGDFAARPRFSTLLTAASPLMVDGALLDFHATTAAHGVPVEVFTVPMAGATAPVTLAGTVVQGIAEFLGVATAMQTLAPGARLIMGVSGSIMDMRAANICYAAPENGLMNAACIEVAHHMGVPAIVPGLATEAKHPGEQAGYEKALKGLTTAAAYADVMSGGVGMLDSVNTLYLPQIVIDTEIVGMIRTLLGEVDMSREAMLLDMIERVGIGGNFLREKETTRRIRAGEHYPVSISARQSYDAWRAEGRDEVAVARALMEELLAAHRERPRGLDDVQRERLFEACGAGEYV